MRRFIFALMLLIAAMTSFSTLAAPHASTPPRAALLTMTPSPRPIQGATETPPPVAPNTPRPFAPTVAPVPPSTSVPLRQGGLRFQNGYSVLKVGEWRVTLTICADNLDPGTPIYAVAFRDAVETMNGSEPISSTHWVYEQVATEDDLFSLISPSGTVFIDRCILFDGYTFDPADPSGEMEGMDLANETYPAIPYYTQATLDPVIGASFYTEPYAAWDRGGCAIATDNLGLCDSVTSPFFFRTGFNDTGV